MHFKLLHKQSINRSTPSKPMTTTMTRFLVTGLVCFLHLLSCVESFLMATVPLSHHRQPCQQQQQQQQQSPITTLFYTDERKSASTSKSGDGEQDGDIPATELFHTVLDFERIAQHHTNSNNHQQAVIPSKLACDAAIEVEWWEPTTTGADVSAGVLSSPEGGILAVEEDVCTANKTTELHQRITKGVNYVHTNNNNSNGMDANTNYDKEKEEAEGRIPSVRAVFCGYRYTADDYHRLKTAAEEEEDQQKQQQQQHPNTYEI